MATNAERQQKFREHHKDRLKVLAKETREYRAEKNLCTRCGKDNKNNTTSWCPECLDKHNEWVSSKKKKQNE